MADIKIEIPYCPSVQGTCTNKIVPCLYKSISGLTCQLITYKKGYPKRIIGPLTKRGERQFICKKYGYRIIVTIVMAIVTLITSLINLFPTGMFLYNWAVCPNNYSDICYTFEFHSEGENVIPKIVLKDDIPNERLINYTDTKEKLQDFEDVSKVFVLVATFASSISYLLFMWALWYLFARALTGSNLCRCWKRFRMCLCCSVRRNDNETIKPFDPFNDKGKDYGYLDVKGIYQMKKQNSDYEYVRPVLNPPQPNNQPQPDDPLRVATPSLSPKQDNDTSTLLQGERLAHFSMWFIIGSLLLITLFIVFFWAQYIDADSDIRHIDSFQWEVITLVFYAWSLVCSVSSCFIFSKLMYGVQRKCEELEVYVYHVNEEYDNILNERSDVYKYVNDLLIKQAKKALKATKQAAKECLYYAKKNLNDLCYFVDNTNIINQLDGAIVQLPEEINEVTKEALDKLTTKAKKFKEDEAANNCRMTKIAANDVEGSASAATMILKEHKKIFTPQNNEGEEEKEKRRHKLALKYLQERDKHFVKRAVVTMEWFQLWFLFHWILHILSAFLVVALLLDAIILHFRAKLPHLKPGVEFHPAEIGFLFMLSVVQTFLLLYPCLRAASVTRTRQRVIHKISEEYRFSNIPGDLLFDFIKSMKEQKFAFRLYILCARITFNLNVAYISFAVGLIGVIVSLVTTLVS